MEFLSDSVMGKPYWMWALFIGVVGILLVFDLGVLEFEDVEDAKEAIDNMDQADLFGRTLKVSAAKPPKSAESGLHSKTAVWEQVRDLPGAFVVSRHA